MAATPVDALKAISSEIQEQRSEQVTFTSVFVETSQFLADGMRKRDIPPKHILFLPRSVQAALRTAGQVSAVTRYHNTEAFQASRRVASRRCCVSRGR